MLTQRSVKDDDRFGREPHVVQFYRTVELFSHTVAAWIAPVLDAEGGALLIGRPLHTAKVRRSLADHGVTGAIAEKEGRLIILDAKEILDHLCHGDEGGFPDGARLHTVVGDLLTRIRHACGDAGAPIRAWGEMVDVLVSQGRSDAALSLEHSWNDVISREGIRLLCSYESTQWDADEHAALWSAVRRPHGHLLLEATPRGAAPSIDARRAAAAGVLTSAFGSFSDVPSGTGRTRT